MGSLSGRRWLLALIPVLAVAWVVFHFVSLTRRPVQPAPAFSAHSSGVVFAAGARSSGPWSGSSNYRSHCASCHGAGGRGDGWQAWLYRLKMRDLTDAVHMETLSDDYMFQIIKHGGATLGKPGMPSWGQELTDEEIRGMVGYIRGLAAPKQQPQPAGTAR